jgi:uncharacterized protein (DUF488 family)
MGEGTAMMSGKTEPKDVSPENGVAILTIGHSTRTIEEFIALLLSHGVGMVVDVRTVPRSRHNPQFNRDTIPETLAAADVAYSHMPGLGGLRHARAGSPNSGWQNDSFRGFADFMQCSEFAENIDKLIELGKSGPIALMCAEALPWRCHRSLIADALLVRGVNVAHIMGRGKRMAHELTSFARVDGGRIVYHI